MAVLADILPVVSRSSALALKLYGIAAESPGSAKDLVGVANSINGFAAILKQLGTIIKEDDRLPSPEAIDTLDDVIDQAQTLLTSFESTSSTEDEKHHDQRDISRSTQNIRSQLDPSTKASLDYLTAHLEALSMTLSVLLQTLYAAQTIMWSKVRPTVSPQQATKLVDSERIQLETLIVQQQLSILSASNLYENLSQSDARLLLMEGDSSQSLVITGRGETPRSSTLRSYQDEDLTSLDTSIYTEANGLPAVLTASASRVERLLQQWTSLPLFERRLQDEERERQRQRWETQQATVESDSEEESRTSKLSGDGARRTHRSGSIQPLFAEVNGTPSPPQEKQYGPTTPPTPIATPRTSRTSMPPATNEQYPTASPRSSLGSLPVEAAAAVEAKEEDSEADLEIPWKLCTRKYYWRFVDAKMVSSNTDQAYSLAYLERSSWTEIMASWVCKEAIREAGFRYTSYQKERKDNRRIRGETCFCIERPLQFEQIKRLVERTVDIYRKAAAPTPPQQPQVRRSSFNRPPPPHGILKGGAFDRNRTPVPRSTHPPLDRSNTSNHLPPPPGPPPLDRSLSMPGPGLIPPPPPPPPQSNVNSRTPNVQIPMPNQYAPQQPPLPQSSRLPQYPPQMMNTTATPQYFPPPPPANAPFTNPPLPSHSQPQNQNYPVQASPLRQSYMRPSNRRYDDDFTTSESELERPRQRRSKSRSRMYEKERERERDKYGKKSHTGRKAAAGALLGVGGLTALLDGLSGL
ncbi:hypothetical protein AG0111_0g10732 [Alternaria gaisen]|uniref:Uncharacterized protein n=1 Tax=Alternaria gaisen TaxID=167740 RepID=A0ACB6F8W9_9PLEO|nr:hypothetical protein AG0111_0g10732 [Alternaria gaisen]